ncbi:MAG: Cytochrome C553 (soluble cytochrome f) [uncultured Sulfurovum sp.]|uniref:Cytochrome C553 (Soluble cytochrome f) n=1 Tax=uncultured Sulfurovum sp. TaxID=269237 RepID=A0A6S6TXX5_9BACT|nr:MAG: Cytochrome C553 (soluble cytochrome f) [uncultured Sulfurovum sp.]
MIKQSIITIATLGLLSVTASAFDTASCVGCHGANFEKSALGKSKIVNEMTAEAITTALNGYKDGSYGGPMKAMMKGPATGMDDAAIKAFADAHGKKADDNTTEADSNTTEAK